MRPVQSAIGTPQRDTMVFARRGSTDTWAMVFQDVSTPFWTISASKNDKVYDDIVKLLVYDDVDNK